MSKFPVDDITLILLDSACQINPDSGHTEVMSFLEMGERIKSKTLVSDPDDPGIPIYEVEHEEGFEPWSPHEVIRALIAEIQRLRTQRDELFELAQDLAEVVKAKGADDGSRYTLDEIKAQLAQKNDETTGPEGPERRS